MIEAVNASNVTVWSWHIWISDYVPVGLDASRITDATTRDVAIDNARRGTQGGAVQVYQGASDTGASFAGASAVTAAGAALFLERRVRVAFLATFSLSMFSL